MHAPIRDRLTRALLADLYCQALRDAALSPAFHYHLARAQVADVYDQVQRDARRGPRR